MGGAAVGGLLLLLFAEGIVGIEAGCVQCWDVSGQEVS